MFRILAVVLLFTSTSATAEQLDIVGPPGSGLFGNAVSVLPNGNFVVTDSNWSNGPIPHVGAVYLFDPNRNLISTLTGSAAYDAVGSDGITVLANGHFVVSSSLWDNDSTPNVGAYTWVDGANGLNGVVSAANSLIGTSTGDLLSGNRVVALTNGNYVTCTVGWTNGSAEHAGAATWGDGTTGNSANISSANSLVGTKQGDLVCGTVIALPNGNYLITSFNWGNGELAQVGAVTWGNGYTGVVGALSAQNSLVGSHEGDMLGSSIVTLVNGNYVLTSAFWSNGAVAQVGAATFGLATQALTGEVSASNSLIGGTAGDGGSVHTIALSDGNYVVANPNVRIGDNTGTGAVTWGNGTIGTTGVMSPANSLVGSNQGDHVGFSVVPLSNGHYVVGSPSWKLDSSFTGYQYGAVTWMQGGGPESAVVSTSNSLYGTGESDTFGVYLEALANGNYVASSPQWMGDVNNNYPRLGVVTWGNGAIGTTGAVSSTNSLIGTYHQENVGAGIVPLTNSNYVECNGGNCISFGESLTWRDGSGAFPGTTSVGNKFMHPSSVVPLTNGNFVALSQPFGSLTWGSGISGLPPSVSPDVSLVGLGGPGGQSEVFPLSDGDYVLSVRQNDGIHFDSITLLRGDRPAIGGINANNTVFATTMTQIPMVFSYDQARKRLVIGRASANRVTLFNPPIFADDFERPSAFF